MAIHIECFDMLLFQGFAIFSFLLLYFNCTTMIATILRFVCVSVRDLFSSQNGVPRHAYFQSQDH